MYKNHSYFHCPLNYFPSRRGLTIHYCCMEAMIEAFLCEAVSLPYLHGLLHANTIKDYVFFLWVFFFLTVRRIEQRILAALGRCESETACRCFRAHDISFPLLRTVDLRLRSNHQMSEGIATVTVTDRFSQKQEFAYVH